MDHQYYPINFYVDILCLKDNNKEITIVAIVYFTLMIALSVWLLKYSKFK